MPASFDYTHGATLLKAENVNVTLGGCQILRDLNLEIKDIRRPDAIKLSNEEIDARCDHILKLMDAWLAKRDWLDNFNVWSKRHRILASHLVHVKSDKHFLPTTLISLIRLAHARGRDQCTEGRACAA